MLLHVVEDNPFVISHSITLSPGGDDISGDIVCHGGVIVDVTTYLEIEDRNGGIYARTAKYSYHARFEHDKDILRYDNSHIQKGQRRHHKHEYDADKETITDLGDDWPHLSDVLAELQELVW